MTSTEKVQLILLEEFANAQARNPNYSMRAFARKVGVPQSAISEFLSGKRSITKKYAEKILRGLDRSPEEILELTEPSSQSVATFKSVDMDVFRLIADWYYFAILSLAETEDFQSSEEWIARRLGISVKVASDAVELLLRLGMLGRDAKSKKWLVTGEQYATFPAISNPALKKACRQNIELAQNALENTQFSERDFTAITLCFDPDRMNEAKKLIQNFRRQFCKAMESKKKKEVYKFTLQLFPLTHRGSL